MAALKAAVLATPPEAWFEDTIRQDTYSDVHQNTRSIIMVFIDTSVWPAIRVGKRKGWDYFADHARPVIETIVSRHYKPGGVIIRAMIANLLPGARIAPHIDTDPSFAIGHRIHVPLVTNPLVAVVNPTRLPVKTFAEFVAAVKKEPGKISYGTPGNGSLPHLAVELFGVQSGTSALHVPYKGGGPAVVDLVGGQISFMFASPLEVMPHVKAGRLLTLGVTSDKRVSYWPDVPTLKEAGYKEYEAYAWFGVVAPAATPRDIIAKLNADIVAVLKSPDVSERLAAQGADVAATSAEEFGRFLAAEHVRWSAAVKAANVTVQ
jgi:hypothetical protein